MFVFRGYALVCAKYQNDFNLQYLFAMIFRRVSHIQYIQNVVIIMKNERSSRS